MRKQICPTRLHKKQQRRFRVVQLRCAQRRVVCNPRHGEGIPNAPCIGEHHAFSGVQLTDKGEAVLTAAAANDQCPAIQCSAVACGAERERSCVPIRRHWQRNAVLRQFYKTDVADVEQLSRLIRSIPSPKAEPFKLLFLCRNKSSGWLSWDVNTWRRSTIRNRVSNVCSNTTTVKAIPTVGSINDSNPSKFARN